MEPFRRRSLVDYGILAKNDSSRGYSNDGTNQYYFIPFIHRM